MNKYSSLKIVSTVFKVFGWVILIAGIIIIINYVKGISELDFAFLLIIVPIVLYTFLGFILSLAIAEFIILCINTADKIENIAENIYFLASKKEEESKT